PPISLSFQLTATDSFGSSSATVNVTVVGATDLLDPTLATAVWRDSAVPKKPGTKVGQKGGKLTITASSSVISPSVNLTAVGYGAMTNLGAGNYTLNVTGVTIPPQTVTVRSSLGGLIVIPVTFR